MKNTNKQLNTDETVANTPVSDDTTIASDDAAVDSALYGQSNTATQVDIAMDESADSQPTQTIGSYSDVNAIEQNDGGISSATARTKNKISKAVDILLWILVAVLATLVFVRAFVYTDVTVKGESMVPTYQHEEVVHVSKVKSPQRGDVVVFYKNDVQSKFLALFASRTDSESGGKYEKLIKRVVAISGDKIWVEEVEQDIFQVVVETSNGTIYHEDYYVKDGNNLPADRYLITSDPLYGLGRLKGYTQDNPFTVGEGYFFAMGDNRGDSYDSRSFGEVPLDRLFGVVL